jgi:hypothetical protein
VSERVKIRAVDLDRYATCDLCVRSKMPGRFYVVSQGRIVLRICCSHHSRNEMMRGKTKEAP